MHFIKISTAILITVLMTVPFTLLLPADGWAREELIVTTRKKEENLQDVPISVSAITDIQIEEKGINSIKDVAKYMPGVEFDEGYGGQDTRIVIRGLSPTRGRSNAAFLVDGIDFTGEAMTTAGGAFSVNQRLLDIERIEVVKGPQSALYGRSAFAGAVQYITKSPNLDAMEAEIAAEGGFFDAGGDGGNSDGQYKVSGAFGMPLGNTFGLRVNANVYDEAGFYNNSMTDQEVGGAEGSGIALTGLWEPNSNLSVKGRLAYSEDEYQTRAQARVHGVTPIDLNDSVGSSDLIYTPFFGPFTDFSTAYPNCIPPSFGPPAPGNQKDGRISSCLGTPKLLVTGKVPDGDDLTVVQSPDPHTGNNYEGTDVDITTFTLVADWNTDIGAFSSHTGLANTESDQIFDGDWDAITAGTYLSNDGLYSLTLFPCGPTGMEDCSPVGQEISFANETDLFSQEFRYATDLDGAFNFTFGALFWNEDVDQTEPSYTVSPVNFRGVAGPPAFALPTASAVFTGAAGGLDTRANTKSRETEHWSIYGLVDWEINEALKLTLEGRYVDEELTVVGPQCDPDATQLLTGLASSDDGSDVNGDGVIDPGDPAEAAPDGILDSCNSAFRGNSSLAQTAGGTLPDGTWANAATTRLAAKTSEDFFAPKATLEWRPNDNQMWYASVGQGVKPGGISTIAGGTFFDPVNNTFDKEELVAYEIGGKTIWAGGDVIVNGALFFQDYTDKQVGVTQFDTRIQSDVSSIENAGEAEIWGLELDTSWQINDNWFVSGAYTWTDAEYTRFESTTASSSEVARSIAAGNGGCLEIIDNDPADPADGVSDVCRINRTGNDIEDVPEHTFVGYGRFSDQLGTTGLEWFLDANVIYTDDRYIEENNIKQLDSYWMVDTRLGVTAKAWEVILFVDNLFDDDTVKSGVDVGSQVRTFSEGHFPPGPSDGLIVSLPDPRIIGIRARYRFDVQ